jgi:LPS sulfotransferase NodH
MPRSGSALLCEALWHTDLAGRPGEHFHPDHYDEEAAAALAHVEAVRRERTTPNGVFGTKLMATHLAVLAGRLRRLPRWALPAPQLLRALFHDPRFVWLRRRDEVRQAVSLWRAEATGVYGRRGEDPAPPAPEYDFPRIADCVRRVRAWNATWEAFFRAAGGPDVTLIYEDDLERAGCEDAVRRILACVGVDAAEGLRIRTTHRKMSDEDTERAVLRFRREAAALGHGPERRDHGLERAPA